MYILINILSIIIQELRERKAHLIGPPLSAFVGVVSQQVGPPPWWLFGPGTGQTRHWWLTLEAAAG